MTKKIDNRFFSVKDGLAIFGPEIIKILGLLEDCFLALAADFDAQLMLFPPLIPIKDLSSIDYFKNFPHLGVFTSSIQDELLVNKYSKENEVQVIPNIHLTSSKYALPSAACYNVYRYLSGVTLDETPKCITTVAKCFRNEQHYDNLIRLFGFTLREIVFIGSDEDVKQSLAKSKQKILDLTTKIGLPIEARFSTDPFYDAQGSRAQLQRLFPVKEEFVYNNGTLAIASVNFHRTFFSERFNFQMPDGKSAFSGCVGMGLERWIYALMNQFNQNIELICCVLSGYLDERERHSFESLPQM